MKAESWIKASKPIFEKNNSTTFSTGHASFVQSPDGTEDYLVFHATRFAGTGWNGRGVRVQRVYWNEDGTPFLGTSAEYTDKVKVPSGTKKVTYHKLEAEDAVLTGLNGKETYNSSSGACVYGLSDESKTAEFTFDVDEAGDYMLYLGASADVNGAALKVVVNGDEYEKNIYNFNANGDARLCVDNWFGYEQKVSLKEGSNTIIVSGVSGKNTAALDYIEYCKYEDAIAPNKGSGETPDEPGAEPETPDTPADPEEPGTTPQTPVEPTNPGNGNQGKPEETKAPTVENNAPTVHNAGDTVAINGASYTIISAEDGKQAVTYDKPENTDSIRATIPATITVDNVEYKVTEIADGAFKGNKSLKKVTIGSNVEKIGKKTFYKCKNLKNITISSKSLTKKSVGKNAFKGISEKAKIKVPKKVLKDYTKIFKAKGLNKKTQSVVKK